MIHLSNISKQHGSQVLFRDASFQILPGTRTGLVGPNGAGKTTHFPHHHRRRGSGRRRDHLRQKDHYRLFFPGCGRDVGPFGPGGGDGRFGRDHAPGGRAEGDGGGHVRAHGRRCDGCPAGALRQPPRRSSSTAAATIWIPAPRPCSPASASARTASTSRWRSFSGGWKMRIALARILTLKPGRAAAGRADQPPGRGVDHLAGGVAGQRVQRRAPHDQP